MSGHIAKWHAEHANYRKLLNLLQSETERFVRGARPDYELMSEVVFYMTQYPDLVHHPREDAAFRQLLARDQVAWRLVGELSREHQAISASSATLAADLDAAADGVPMLRATLDADVRTYVALLTRHMDTEEREIFPRLAAQLDSRDWFLVNSAVHFAADPLFGETVHERFKAIHRSIARHAGCRCPEPAGDLCCLE
ncbi:hemerythrin domain-containing protein [Aromatoleum sp.]|uniref:hemerythrin domain-containing protein n=1 Tax=Aromatoleum sp. TaxID=2307007 RepID=UPI002B48E9AD|nr:hemerythrin domain-containing protein [Aromatoleum sp.]